jgi:hypothetical protein
MGGKEVVFDKVSKRVGLVISSTAGKETTRKLVLWEPNSQPIETQLGKNIIGGQFPSLLILKHSAQEFLESLWQTDEGAVVRMALDSLPEKQGSAKDVVKKLSSSPSPIEATDSHVGKILKALSAEALVTQDSSRKGWYSPSSALEAPWPAGLQWIWDYDSERPAQMVKSSNDEEPATVKTIEEIPKGSASLPSDSPLESAPEAAATTITLDPPEFFISEILGGSGLEPEGYATWLASPWDAATSIDSKATMKGAQSLKKAKQSHWAIISLTHRSSWQDNDAPLFSKIFNSSIISQIGKSSTLDFASKPWIKIELIKAKSVDFTASTPLQILRADERIEALAGSGVVALAQLRDHILKSTKFKIDYLESRKQDQAEIEKLLVETVVRTPWNSGRLPLAIKAIKTLRLDLQKLSIFQDASIEDVEATLKSELASTPAQKQWLREAAGKRVNQTLPNLSGMENALRVLSMVKEFGLLVDSKSLGQALRKSMLNDPNTNYLVIEIFNESAVQDQAALLEEAEKRAQRDNASLKELVITVSKNEAELKRLQGKLNHSRSAEEDGLAKEAASAKLPILKALARSMAAARELLDGNPQGLARFEMIGDQVGLQTIGVAGSQVPFDPEVHESGDRDVQRGEMVIIQNVGFSWQDGHSELVLLKALVL